MNLLVTVLFLLSSGAPASKAYVVCDGVQAIYSGPNDTAVNATGAPLIVDARGAVIFITPPVTLTCYASHEFEVFQGQIVVSRAERVMRVYLKEES